jgi:hypothetical protein
VTTDQGAGAAEVFDVSIVEADEGWRVEIAAKTGRILSMRACRDGAQARIYASTVRQHLYWLSAKRFGEYYSLEG